MYTLILFHYSGPILGDMILVTPILKNNEKTRNFQELKHRSKLKFTRMITFKIELE